MTTIYALRYCLNRAARLLEESQTKEPQEWKNNAIGFVKAAIAQLPTKE